MQCAQGAFGRALIKTGASPYTWSAGSRVRYWKENILYSGEIDVPDMIEGTLQEKSERARRGVGVYGGTIVTTVNPADMVTWLPLFMGGTAVGTSFPYAETVPTFGMLIDKVTRVFEYPNGVVDWCLIEGKRAPKGSKKPSWLTMALGVLFKDETPDVAFPSGPALPVTAGYTDFTFTDTSLTILGAARKPTSFSLLIHRQIDPRYVTSVTPVLFCPTRFDCVLRAAFPFDDDHDDLHVQALAGAAGSLAFSNGTISTTFTFGNLQSPPKTPVTEGKTEIPIETTLVARKLGSTDAIACVNDSTP